MTEALRNTLKKVIAESNTTQENNITEGLQRWREVKIVLKEAGIILIQSSDEIIRIRDLGMMACGIMVNPTLSSREAYNQLIKLLETFPLPTTKQHKRQKSDAETRKANMIKSIKEIFPYDIS